MFVSGDLAGYLDGLRRLRALDLDVLCPGHGPPIWDVRGEARRLHRRTASTASGGCSPRSSAACSGEDELLDAAWDDAPPELRPFAAISLRAHLEKLRAEGRALEPAVPSSAGRRRRTSPASATRRRAISIAAASGVVPVASAWSSTVRTVSAIARTRSSARATCRSPRARARPRC